MPLEAQFRGARIHLYDLEKLNIVVHHVFETGRQLDPSYPVGHRQLGILLAQTARHVEAHACLCRTRELDPLLGVHHVLSAQVAFSGRNYAAALEFARQTIAIDPELWSGHHQAAQAYERRGELELALNELNLAVRFSSGNGVSVALRGC